LLIEQPVGSFDDVIAGCGVAHEKLLANDFEDRTIRTSLDLGRTPQ
jgi:hypothetical protein